MVGQITGGAAVSVEDLMKVADEAAQIMEYSSQLEAKSAELERTARQLREANEKLTQLSIQKDAFLSQISHELRTPMTSIRAFSEILMATDRMKTEERTRYSRIIHDESRRLTRLLDDLLDLSVLENGKVSLRLETLTLSDVIDRAVAATEGQGPALVHLAREGRRSGRGHDRPRPARAGLHQPHHERAEILPGRAAGASHPHEPRGRGRHGRLHRQRGRHPARQAGPDLREVLAPHRHPRGRERGARPRDLPRGDGQAWRLDRLPAGSGRRGLPRGPAARPGGGGLRTKPPVYAPCARQWQREGDSAWRIRGRRAS
jgi:hypothetical protein